MIDEHPASFQPGLIVNQEFFDYPAMQESAKNWLFLARYRFDTGDFYGRHDGIQLHNMQFGHADRHEGMMFHGTSPKECLTIVLLQKSNGKVCLNNHKMNIGDIIIIDDVKSYEFSSSHHTVMAIISIRKSLFVNSAWLLEETDKKFKDFNNMLSQVIEAEWKNILERPNLYQDDDKLRAVENKILNTISYIFKEQKGVTFNLTKGEQTALKIKSFLLESLVEDITIDSIVSQFNISHKTLENSFKSLFGITPKHFLMLLKLNHSHEELLLNNEKVTNVSDIAIKWGFSNFGRFAQNYKALFGVLPSETLHK
jgi:AraC-like DNA-binding protein